MPLSPGKPNDLFGDVTLQCYFWRTSGKVACLLRAAPQIVPFRRRKAHTYTQCTHDKISICHLETYTASDSVAPAQKHCFISLSNLYFDLCVALSLTTLFERTILPRHISIRPQSFIRRAAYGSEPALSPNIFFNSTFFPDVEDGIDLQSSRSGHG